MSSAEPVRGTFALPALLMAVLLVAVSLAAGCGGGGEQTADTPAGGGEDAEAQTVEIYFPGDGGMIYPERRLLALPDMPEDKIRLLVDALLEGPRHRSDVVPLFSFEVVTGEIYISPSGTAFIDLRRAEESEEGGEAETREAQAWSMGSTEELQIVMSLVNTVVDNVPEVERVALLWEGVQPETFAGHVDTTRPLAADRSLVAR